jgi:hypothetical protein
MIGSLKRWVIFCSSCVDIDVEPCFVNMNELAVVRQMEAKLAQLGRLEVSPFPSTSTSAICFWDLKRSPFKRSLMSSNQTIILLRPRPLAKFSSAFLLLPLLPHPKPLRPLPAELWSKIFAYALACEEAKWSWSLLRVCKGFKVSLS